MRYKGPPARKSSADSDGRSWGGLSYMGMSANDWRGAVLDRVRATIRRAVPEAVEEVKWRKPSNPAGVPTWSHAGLICTGETYKDKVKLTFAHGAALADPAQLFNASLDAGTRRAIDIRAEDELDEAALAALVRAAAERNETRRG